MIKLIPIYIIFLFFGPQMMIGQENEVTEKEYQAFIDELGYDKTRKGLRLREKFKPKPIEENTSKKTFKSGGFILQLIAYFLIFMLVVFILYMIFSNVHLDKKLAQVDDEFDEFEALEDIDARAIYKKAVAEGNHLLAIRMHFIICLQELSKKGKIDWEKEKTNRDYYREISDTGIKRPFRDIANIFERCCYSDVTLGLSDFNRFDQKFLDFLNLLK